MFQIIIYSLLLVALIAWIYNVIYSLFFSPLKHIPGPIEYQLFPLLHSIQYLAGREHLICLDLHNKYGKAVRLGWFFVSFASQETYKEIYASYKLNKAPIYSGFQIAGNNLFSTFSKDVHRSRRKIIFSAFTEAAVLKFEKIANESGMNPMIQRMQEVADIPNASIDLSILFHNMAFDIIGEYVFGKSFDMSKGSHHPVVDWINYFLLFSGIRGTFPIFKNYVDFGIKNLKEFAKSKIIIAIESTDNFTINRKNNLLMDYFNAVDDHTGEKLSLDDIASDAIVQLVAGTDTSTNALTWTFYMLFKNPHILNKLKKELQNTFKSKSEITYEKCKDKCLYLNAVINEALRMYPPAGAILPRYTQEDTIIGGYLIPKNITVGVALYALQNLDSEWESPREFKPERWIKDGKIHSKSNYFPFSLGPRGCAGRSLALLEMYLTVANLIYMYDLELVDPSLTMETINQIVLKPKDNRLYVKVKTN